MSFFAFGFNYESASAELRDAFALDEESIRAVCRYARHDSESEAILLSTCNRTEVYLFGDEEDVIRVKQRIGEIAGYPWEEASSFLRRDEDAVLHVLQVASGLKSLVLGDAQILSQVKQAYRIAVEEDAVGTVLHRLMHSAFRAAKRVLTETGLGAGSVSVASAAVALARAHFDKRGYAGLSGRSALILGAGQMARLAAHALSKADLSELIIANRSRERAQILAQATGGRVISWADRHLEASRADVVIVATGSEKPVLESTRLADPSGGNVLVIDISVPRNVEGKVDDLPGYEVLDLDALKRWLREAEIRRIAEVPRAEAICEETLAEFVSWMIHQQALQPGIQAIRDTFEAIRRQEIDRHGHRFSDADREELEILTRSIMQKLLAVPIVKLKGFGPESLDFARSVELLCTLFSRPTCEDELEEHPRDERAEEEVDEPKGSAEAGEDDARKSIGSTLKARLLGSAA